LATLIFVLGAPRSGTTWLAKIIDSHPAVIYRHEPDKLDTPGEPGETIPALVHRWAAERRPEAVTKRPFFRKSWQSPVYHGLRWCVVALVTVLSRIPSALRPRLAAVPDFASAPPSRLLIKSVAFARGVGPLARSLPESRIILILRHPCGQIASLMRGNRQKRFDLRESGTDMPYDALQAIRHAAAHGVTEAAFAALTDAGKYAWAWRAFNETAHAAIAGLPNALIVPYEALCQDPPGFSRKILAFVGLDWNRQTQDFVSASSTHAGSAGYYAVYRNAAAAADAWQTTMPTADKDAVLAVVAGSPLIGFWADQSDATV
jgi:LPS sulfotransferase NodH